MKANPWQRLSQEPAPGFGRLQLLLDRLGHPEENLPPVVQVAGTHGKSSVALLLEAVFHAAGLRVGVCTSPDFSDPGEALRLGGEPVSPWSVSALLASTLEPWEEFLFGPGKPTVHEALTALALAHFAQARVELVILEASTGHRWDPTNFLRPWLSLLTCLQAGGRTGQVIWNAASLARPGVPLVTTAVEEEALEVLVRACRESGAALTLVDPADVELLDLRWEGAVWRSRTDPLDLGPFETTFLGLYQTANLSLVLAALAELFGGLPLSREAVRSGLAQARLPGRFELIHTQPWIVADAAQDEEAASALQASLERLPFVPGRRTLLLTHPEARLGGRIKDMLRPNFQEVFFTTPAELPLHLPRVLRGLSSEDFFLLVGPHPVLREVASVIQETP